METVRPNFALSAGRGSCAFQARVGQVAKLEAWDSSILFLLASFLLQSVCTSFPSERGCGRLHTTSFAANWLFSGSSALQRPRWEGGKWWKYGGQRPRVRLSYC